MTTMEPAQSPRGGTYEQGGLLAPWWHTALMVLVILWLSVAGVRQLRTFGDQPLHLVANYCLTIAYEWFLAGLVLWGLYMRKVPLRQLLGERGRAPGHGWAISLSRSVTGQLRSWCSRCSATCW